MTCIDKTIKDLLLPYLGQGLERTEQERVAQHLKSCADCQEELSLLRLLAEETVPDPGEAFWLAMPERVRRAVHQEKERKGRFSLPRTWERFILPRWAWAAAAAGVVLLVSWVAFLALLKSPERPLSPGYEFPEEVMQTDLSAADPAQISELDPDELDTAAAWAGNELASIAPEIERGIANAGDTDLDEELRQLNAQEVERLSTMLDRWKQEG